MKPRKLLSMLLALALLICSVPVAAAQEPITPEPAAHAQIITQPIFTHSSTSGASYPSVSFASDTLARAKTAEGSYLIDPWGGRIGSLFAGNSGSLDLIEGCDTMVLYSKNSGSAALYTVQGKRLSDFRYSTADKIGNYIRCWLGNGIYDYYTLSGKKITVKNLPANHEIAAVFSDNLVLAGTVDRSQWSEQPSYAVFRTDGTRLTDYGFVGGFRVNESLIALERVPDWYLYDNNGHRVDSRGYNCSFTTPDEDGYFWGRNNSTGYLFDETGKFQFYLQNSQETIRFSSNAIVNHTYNSTYDLYDGSGNLLVSGAKALGREQNTEDSSQRTSSVGQPEPTLFSLRLADGTTTVFNNQGEIILENLPNAWICNGIVRTATNDGCVFYNNTGEELFSIDNKKCKLVGGLIAEMKEDKYAFYNISGERVTDYCYDRLESANAYGLYNAQRQGKWYLVNAEGQEQNELGFDVPVSFTCHMSAYLVKGMSGTLRYMEPGDNHPFFDVPGGKWYTEAVEYCYENGLMSGTGTAHFEPSAVTARAMLVQVLYNYVGNGEICGSRGFTDVPDGKWFSNAVNWAAEYGIVYGTSDTEFSPDSPVTREQTAAILYRFAKLFGADVSSTTDLSSFPDGAAVSDWATDSVQWAVAIGLIRGEGQADGSVLLAPQARTDRAELATLIMRFLNLIELSKAL